MDKARQPAGISWPDLSGHIREGRHILPIRVYFEDTDFSGLVYHASYLRWCERGRSDFLRLAGIGHQALATGAFVGVPAAFVVRRLKADFLKPARIDEMLEIVTETGELTKASITLNQIINREQKPIFQLEAQCVLVSLDGRLLRMPSDLLRAIPRKC